MSDDTSKRGYEKERELFEFLCNRFGSDCVYQSPKIDKPCGAKELCDILVLALPYAIVFQSKWMQLTADDLNGADAAVKKGRLIRRMENAAKQFTEFASSLKQSKSTVLPKVWIGNRNAETFELPLQWIERIVPVVVIDFDDANYGNPQLRYLDIPPVILDVPSQIQNWGKVHGFLLKDFERIIQQLFRVGDLLLWLNEREKLFNGKAFVGYNEMTLFMLYLYNRPLWEKLREFNGVWLDDNDLFERTLRKNEEEFNKRQKVFAEHDIVDVLEQELLCATKDVLAKNPNDSIVQTYLSYSGRIKCWPIVMKKNIAAKFMELLAGYRPLSGREAMNGSYGIYSDIPVAGTLYYLGVIKYDDKTSEMICWYILQRALAYIRKRGVQNAVKEMMIILTNPEGPSICCALYPIDQQTYAQAMNENDLKRTRLAFSAYKATTSEWDMVRRLDNGEFVGWSERTDFEV